MTNRVKELESRVSALEATVKGLTEELVMVNDRLRELEDGRDGDDSGGTGTTNRRRRNGRSGEANNDKRRGRLSETNEGKSRERDPRGDVTDDIIIA